MNIGKLIQRHKSLLISSVFILMIFYYFMWYSMSNFSHYVPLRLKNSSMQKCSAETYINNLHGFKFDKLTINVSLASPPKKSSMQKCSAKTYNNNLYGFKFDQLTINVSLASHPNMPLVLFINSEIPIHVPDFQSIRWTEKHWQESSKYFSKFLLYSAHFDVRDSAQKTNKTHIYILGLYEGKSFPEKHFCQIWINKSVIAYPVVHYDIADYQGFSSKRLVPYLLTCIVSPKLEPNVPITVSLVEFPCSVATNLLEVTGTLEKKSNKLKQKENITVGVCGPALYYFNEDFSARLIEWIEVLRIVGVSKVILYRASVHPNIEKVFRYYEGKAFVKIIDFNYPPPYVDEPSLRRLWTEKKRSELFALENIYFSDCILRFKDQFDYLAHWDPDEIPVLKKHNTLGDLMKSLRRQYADNLPASFRLKWKFFPSDAKLENLMDPSTNDSYFYMLRHNRFTKPRLKNHKSIYDTQQVLAAFSHGPLLLLKGSLKSVSLSEKVAYTAHFRRQQCPKNCHIENFTQETFLTRVKEQIIHRVNLVHKDLSLY